MSEWADIIKEKVNSYNKRKDEIEYTLDNLKAEIGNIYMNVKLIDKNILAWEVEIGSQKFIVKEAEIAEKQIVKDRDKYGGEIDTGERRNVKEALQDLIIEKIKSF